MVSFVACPVPPVATTTDVTLPVPSPTILNVPTVPVPDDVPVTPL